MNRQLVQGFFDLCTGCRICELACSSAKLGLYAPREAAVKIENVKEGLAAIPSLCIQCEEPACLKSCPVNAIERDPTNGIVKVIPEKCTACGWCTKACPIEGAIKIIPTSGKAFKCDVCSGDPVCVKYCPTEALKLITLGGL